MTTPAPEFEALQAEERANIMQTFKRLSLELVRGDGWTVYDEAGNAYLDMVAGIAVNVLGHAHPAVVEAVRSQAGVMIHTSNLYYTRPQVELAKKLRALGFEGRMFPANSGAEANECAYKVARKWGKLHRGGAYEVISAEGSFHGRTLANVAATGQEKFKKPVEPMPDGFRQVPFNDIDALKAATSEKTVAILLEPIQGEIGIIPGNTEYLGAVREWCDAQGLLLIFDEIQTGMGRTGTFYAFQGYGVVPDVVTLAKGLGGGIPIGVCLANKRADCLEAGEHGGTFGGGPLACTAALATIAAIEEGGIIENAREVGGYLAERLVKLAEDFECIVEVRGKGLMQAMVLDRDLAPALQEEALGHGLIVTAANDRVVRFLPPLIIGKPEVDRTIEILAVCLDLGAGVIGDKAHRQKAILELVRSRPIHTQDELVEALRALDHSVTQATVSRDIRELGLSREPSPSGSRYAVRSSLNVRLPQVLRDFVVAVDGTQFMVVVHTPPGTANLVAFAIDQSGWPEVIGTVAGDDTVMVVTTGDRERKAVEHRLLELEPEPDDAGAN